jgi:hypothetical protein
MGWACRQDRHSFGDGSFGKRPLERTRKREVNNITMDVRETF